MFKDLGSFSAVPGFRIWGSFSAVPGFRIWGRFPPFRHSAVPPFQLLGSPIIAALVSQSRFSQHGLPSTFQIVGTCTEKVGNRGRILLAIVDDSNINKM